MVSGQLDEKAIFNIARKIDSPDAREEYLRQVCGADAELYQRIETLLHAYEQQASFLESPPVSGEVSRSNHSLPEQQGTQIGPYKLLQQIGEGGFGIVFMAEQLQPVRRPVALKVIKPGMDTRQVIARFEAERQALAVMDHPNIARVFDAGTADSGRPYFAMELVRGIPITRYCDQNSVTIRERLELFATVCQAIQHAHTKGIIHRDIKPTNVLVTRQDDQPVVKVIDFGIAKAIGQQLTDKTLFTNFAQMIGTPLYMSPEQAEFSSTDIDTRSDIYSLGVLLYELLTGSTPVSKEQLKQAAFDEIRRIIREDEPPKPSTRISSAEAAPSIAAQRDTEPAKLTRLVRGELDWIVMKALDKDRQRRYETASSFAADVERYLADEPVSACPPSAMYRFRKFASRNKVALVVASAAVLAVVLAVIGLVVSNVLITQERDQKVAALGQAKTNEEAAQKQQEIAEKNAAIARQHEQTAAASEKRAKASELLACRRYYAAQMNLAMQAWRAGEMPRVLELLEGQRPAPGEIDLRGFEWFYLWRLVNQGAKHLRGHTDAVIALEFSPDGTTLASTSWDWTVRLWDPVSLNQQQVLKGHSPWHLAFSHDGKLLAGGSAFESTNPLWNVRTGERIATLLGKVTGVAFSWDGTTLFGGGDSTRIWEIPSVAQRNTFDHAGILLGVFPDGKTAVTSANPHSPNGRIQFWEIETGTVQRTIPVPHLTAAALSADGSRLAASVQGKVSIWDTATGTLLGTRTRPDGVRGLDFSPDSKQLAAGGEDRCVVIWDLTTDEPIAQFVHLDVVWAVSFSPNGKTLASGTLGGAIQLWETSRVEEATTVPVGGPRCARFSADGKAIVVGCKEHTQIINVATGKEIAKLPSRNVSHISADASTLVSRKTRDEYTVRDIETDRELATILFPQLSDVSPMFSLSPDGKTLAGHCRWRGVNTVTLWDVATQQSKVLKPAEPDSNRLSVLCSEFSPDGKLLAAGFQFQWVTVWEVATGKVKLQLSQKPSMMNVHSVAFSPDGKVLAVGTNLGSVTLWDVDTGKHLASLRGHTACVNSLAFSADGRTLATASDDRTVRLWDVITGQERGTLTGHTDEVGGVCFSPDGSTLVTGSGQTIMFWRSATDPEAMRQTLEARLEQTRRDDPRSDPSSHLDDTTQKEADDHPGGTTVNP